MLHHLLYEAPTGCLSFDVFITFWEQCEESFFICQPQDNLFLLTLLYLGRPINYNNKTPFIPLNITPLNPKCDQKKTHYTI